MAAAVRTDIHAPNADFDPEAYEFVGAYYLGISQDAQAEQRAFSEDVERIEAQGYRHGGPGRGGCDHCGAACIYVAIMLHPASQEWITIGETCLSGRFNATRDEWKSLHARVGQARRDAKTLAAYLAFCEANPVVAYASYVDNIKAAPVAGATGPFGSIGGKSWALDKVRELHNSARNYGNLSVKQIAFLTKLMAELSETADRLPELLAERDAAEAAKAAIPALIEGRQVITGTVVGGQWVDSDYGRYSGAWKITVLLDNGQRVYGTCPAALGGEKGDVVTFTATVKASKDDLTFGFYKSPMKATGPA